MASLDSSVPVTRRELFATVAPLWIFIVLLILRQMRSATYRWTDILLFAAAVASMVMYFRAAYGARGGATATTTGK